MFQQPTASDGWFKAGTVFRCATSLLEQEWAIEFLDVDGLRRLAILRAAFSGVGRLGKLGMVALWKISLSGTSW